jgi:hypothetical protein
MVGMTYAAWLWTLAVWHRAGAPVLGAPVVPGG